MSRLVDLSMPVHRGMITFPRIPAPTLLMYETWQEFAEGIGAAKYGADWLTASYLIIQGDHVGTHCDAIKHIRGPEAPGRRVSLWSIVILTASCSIFGISPLALALRGRISMPRWQRSITI